MYILCPYVSVDERLLGQQVDVELGDPSAQRNDGGVLALREDHHARARAAVFGHGRGLERNRLNVLAPAHRLAELGSLALVAWKGRRNKKKKASACVGVSRCLEGKAEVCVLYDMRDKKQEKDSACVGVCGVPVEYTCISYIHMYRSG